MTLTIALRKRIRELMKLNGIKSVNSLAKLSGVSNTLNGFMSNKIDLLQLDTILHICEGLDMQLYDFFKSPLFDDVLCEKPKK